jgi:hypothetical protein
MATITERAERIAVETGLVADVRGVALSVSAGGVQRTVVLGAGRSLLGRTAVSERTETVYQVTAGGVVVLESADLAWAESARDLMASGAARGLSTREALVEYWRDQIALEEQAQEDAS